MILLYLAGGEHVSLFSSACTSSLPMAVAGRASPLMRQGEVVLQVARWGRRKTSRKCPASAQLYTVACHYILFLHTLGEQVRGRWKWLTSSSSVTAENGNRPTMPIWDAAPDGPPGRRMTAIVTSLPPPCPAPIPSQHRRLGA